MNTLTLLLLLSPTIGMAYSIFNSEKRSDDQANFFTKIFKNIQGPQNAKKYPSSRVWVQTSAKECGILSRNYKRVWCRDDFSFQPLGMLRTLHLVKSLPRFLHVARL
ncbi:hypothetical protein B9Z55_007446 [Caenorhabditis nigoni]|uniref:Uncharacterized protein n=1 Tax=Caenorhabditis nigoni TaxID=1611254 RepID=A0A2G5V9V2_9PELO|nr:hypothetical protein B9Z55_007446 [Caenorhabditis nigoni]